MLFYYTRQSTRLLTELSLVRVQLGGAIMKRISNRISVFFYVTYFLAKRIMLVDFKIDCVIYSMCKMDARGIIYDYKIIYSSNLKVFARRNICFVIDIFACRYIRFFQWLVTYGNFIYTNVFRRDCDDVQKSRIIEKATER